MKKKIYLILFIFLSILGYASWPEQTQSVVKDKQIQEVSFTSQDVLSLVNQTRKDKGIEPLVFNEKLNSAAKLKAQAILDKDEFQHDFKDGTTPWYFFDKVGYDYDVAGENLAIGWITPQAEHFAWLNSPKHYGNIVNSSFSDTGIAILEGEFEGRTVRVTVQLFGSLSKY